MILLMPQVSWFSAHFPKKNHLLKFEDTHPLLKSPLI
jgi:hypothetical protein